MAALLAPVRGVAYLSSVLLSSLGVVFVWQPVADLLFLVSNWGFRKVAMWVTAGFCMFSACSLDVIYRTKYVFHGDRVDRAASVILSNHPSETDWIFLWRLINNGDMSHGMRIALKDPLKYIPIVGTGIQWLNFMFLKRKFAQDERYMISAFGHYEKRRYCKELAFLIFPEGTDLCPEGIEASNRYADKNDLPHYTHVLHPRTKGFVTALEHMPWVDTVYDVTLAYTPVKPLPDRLFLGMPAECHFYVKKYSVASLPKDPAGLETWLQELYRAKEVTLAKFYEEGAEFPEHDSPLSPEELDAYWRQGFFGEGLGPWSGLALLVLYGLVNGSGLVFQHCAFTLAFHYALIVVLGGLTRVEHAFFPSWTAPTLWQTIGRLAPVPLYAVVLGRAWLAGASLVYLNALYHTMLFAHMLLFTKLLTAPQRAAPSKQG